MISVKEKTSVLNSIKSWVDKVQKEEEKIETSFIQTFQEELEEWCEEYDNEFSVLDELHTLLSGLDSLSYYVVLAEKKYRTST